MKDKFHVELAENQIVSQINWKKPTLAIVRGGYTNGGKVRIESLTRGGHKGNAKPHHLIVVTNVQAISLANGIIEEAQQSIQHCNTRINEGDLTEHAIQHNLHMIENYERKITNIEVLIDVLRQGGDGRHIEFRKR